MKFNLKHFIIFSILATLALAIGIYLNHSLSQWTPENLQLTDEETEWLDAHPIISVSPAPFWPPIDIYSDDGHYSGISKEYLDIIERALGVQFVTKFYPTTADLLTALEKREVDIASATAPSPERQKFSVFTSAYFDVPVIIIAKSNFSGEITEADLSQYKVAVGDRFSVHDTLRERYPNIEFLPQPSDREVLESVVYGTADLAVIDIADASYIIDEMHYTQLKIVGNIDYTYTCSFAVRSDYAPLANMINKVLSRIPENYRSAITRRWIKIDVTPFYKQDLFIGIVLIILGLIFTFTISNFLLRREVQRRTAEILKLNDDLERRVEERTKELEDLNHELDSHLSDLVSTQAQLVEAEKYASLGRLVSGIAHKLNTPIGNIFTTMTFQNEMLDSLQSAFENEKMTKGLIQEFFANNKEVLKGYYSNIDQLKNIVNDFKKLEYTAFDYYSPQPFNLFELINRISTDSMHAMDQVALSVQINCPESLEITTYYPDLEQIINILFENACHHGFKNLPKGRIRIDAALHKDTLSLSVWNDGHPIPSDAIADIFTPFYTTDLQHHSGLGLSVLYNLVHHKYKGSISFSSSEEEGTCFKVSLPL